MPGLVACLVLAWAPGACGDGSGQETAVRPTPRQTVPAAIATREWVAMVESISEPGGYFDTDNLVSNESSFLNVLGPMRRLSVYGGAYVGVGPDQNFSYMAQQRPEIAFILDIRRDNLLQHLLFKALFHEANSRVEYLALLLGVAAPDDIEAFRDAGIDEILAWIAEAPGGADTPRADSVLERITERVGQFGLLLSEQDLATIRRFHLEFIRQGLDLRFTTLGEPARPFYPTFGELLAARDLDGRAGSYLARRDDFIYLKALQEANRVVPVVGDLAGPRALKGIGDEVRARGLTVRAFYVSNVEFYLDAGGFERFIEAAAALPMDEYSVLIRSVFPQGLVRRHPQAQPGDYSTQVLVRLTDLRDAVAAGGYESYWDAVTRDAVDPGG